MKRIPRWKKGKPVTVVLWGLKIAVCVYLGLLVVFYLIQSRLLFQPTQKFVTDPGNYGLPFEDVHFTTTDGLSLHGWFVPRPNARGVILFCHGNAGNISHRGDTLRFFHDLGFEVFIFDYRGYGKSQGSACEQGTYKDAAAAWDYLTVQRHFNPSDIVVVGRSMGGPIAAWLAAGYRPRMLVLESTFTSVPDLGKHLFPYLPVKLIARIHYNTLDHVRKVSCPVLVVHSPGDKLVPIKHGRQIYEAITSPKEFLEISGGHNEGFLQSGILYEDGLDRFFSKYEKKLEISWIKEPA